MPVLILTSDEVLPNDALEQDRLDMVHHLFCLTLKGDLCVTKLENPQNVLDLGISYVLE